MKLLVFCSICFMVMDTHAHLGATHRRDSSADQSGTGQFTRETYHSSYGFYENSSDGGSNAEAGESTEFGCQKRDVRGYLANACGSDPISGPLARAVTPVMEVFVVSRLRQQALDYFSVYQKAIEPDRFMARSRQCPPCVHQDSPQCTNHRNGHTENPGASKVYNQSQMLEDNNLVTTLMRYDTLKSNFEARCVRSHHANECYALEEERYRIEMSYPVFFGETIRGKTRHEKARTDQIRNSIKRLLGMRAGATSEEEALQRGGEIYNQKTSSRSVSDHDSLRRDLTAAIERANRPNASSLLRSGMRDYSSQLARSKSELAQLFRSYTDNLCTIFNTRSTRRARESLVQMAFSGPPIIRQALLDMSEAERDMTRAVLCKRKVQPYISRGRNCSGISRTSTDPLTVSVSGNSYLFNWPMASSVGRTIVSSPSETVVRMRVNLKTSPANLTQTQTQAQTMQAQLNEFYNCQSGSIPSMSDGTSCVQAGTPLRNPPLRFQIELNPTTDRDAPEPAFNVSECYNSDIVAVEDRTDCAKVREHRIRNCMTQGRSRETCNSIVPPLGDPRNNRADAGNITFNVPQGTLRHEVAHLMGVADEYVANPYDTVLNPVGESNSLMNNSKAVSARFYPRHFDQILEPLECFQNDGD